MCPAVRLEERNLAKRGEGGIEEFAWPHGCGGLLLVGEEVATEVNRGALGGIEFVDDFVFLGTQGKGERGELIAQFEIALLLGEGFGPEKG